MENKFRCICELCTAISFTAFVINILFYPENISLYICMCSALIALFTLLDNRISDKDMAKKGIGSGKYTTWGKIYRGVLTVRLCLETIVSGINIFLILAYFLTRSNQGNIFEWVWGNMKIFNIIKKDNRDKKIIYQNANSSFDFDYSIQSGADDNGKDEPFFKDANKKIDTSITYELKEVDYYA